MEDNKLLFHAVNHLNTVLGLSPQSLQHLEVVNVLNGVIMSWTGNSGQITPILDKQTGQVTGFMATHVR